MKLKDCMDTDQCGEGELLYECSNLGYNAYNVRFSQMCLNQLSELTYCELCFNGCSNLFGCIGLKRKQFCILNKQYTQAEYVRVSGQLIAHMVRTGEWGESFPSEIASAPYNLSVAQQFKPLTKEKALAAGYSWRDEAIELKGSSIRLPDLLSETDSEITTQTMCCSECRRGYRIITAELDFYRQLGLPAPRLCFLCRHQQRMKTRAPREMLKRSCSCCNNLVDTVYQLDEANTIYCETCYLEALD